ncbi:MAG TPA: hypothetical protein VM658_01540 [bacterium]|nr:hypothetical protein [bacterium]
MKLSGRERNWLRDILEALIPRGGDERYPESALDTGADKIFEEMVLYLPAATAIGLRASLFFIEFMGPLLGLRRRARFSRLAPSDREACLSALSKSDTYFTRQMVLLHKSVACLGWAADERVRTALGLNLPPRFVQRDTEARP